MKSLAVAALLIFTIRAIEYELGDELLNLGPFALDYTIEFPLFYGTTYTAGKGSYTRYDIWEDIDSDMHYEDVGFGSYFDTEIALSIFIEDDTEDNQWMFKIRLLGDIYDI